MDWAMALNDHAVMDALSSIEGDGNINPYINRQSSSSSLLTNQNSFVLHFISFLLFSRKKNHVLYFLPLYLPFPNRELDAVLGLSSISASSRHLSDSRPSSMGMGLFPSPFLDPLSFLTFLFFLK